MRCLEKKPADRFQSAEELLPQLEALATPSGGITPTATAPVPAVPKKVRKGALVAAAVLVVAVISVTVWILATGSQSVALFGICCQPFTPSQMFIARLR